MTQSMRDLLSRLRPDQWRSKVGFSPDVAETNRRIFEQRTDSSRVIGELSRWLEKYQPCLFGRIAAKVDLLAYCIITEEDLSGPEAQLRQKIQDARARWTRDGFDGEKSGLILYILSPRVAEAVPDEAMLALAAKICSLYLLEEVGSNPYGPDFFGRAG